MVFQLETHGFQWENHGLSMGKPWFFNWKPMVLPGKMEKILIVFPLILGLHGTKFKLKLEKRKLTFVNQESKIIQKLSKDLDIM